MQKEMRRESKWFTIVNQLEGKKKKIVCKGRNETEHKHGIMRKGYTEPISLPAGEGFLWETLAGHSTQEKRQNPSDSAAFHSTKKRSPSHQICDRHKP